MKKNKICVYTCITGEYDNLKDINKEKGIDYYCFTNNKNVKSNTWNVIYIEDKELSNVLLARKTKILGNDIVNDYDIALWMDAAVSFTKPIREFINYYLNDDDKFVAFKHGERNNIHEEMVACYRYDKESKDKIIKLEKFYKKEKYPDNNGLIESTVYIKRSNDLKVKETMKIWFDMILNYSHRDQLSFNYAIYKTGLKVKWINKKVFNNDWFKWYAHNKFDYVLEKYSIYFGYENEYHMENDFHGKYKIKNNTFIVDAIAPCDVSIFNIFISNIPCTLLKQTNFNNQKNKIKYYNDIDYLNGHLFYNSPAKIRIFSSLKKGDKIHIELKMHLLNREETYDFINYLNNFYGNKNAKELEKIEKLEVENKMLKSQNKESIDELNKILNSKSWSVTKPLRQLSSIIKK